MDNSAAMAAFAALAQDHRLRVFKRLMEIAPNGLSAGDIARELDIPPSTLSTHLAQLQRAGLLRSWRDRRQIFYTIDIEGTGRIVSYMINNCCHGHPEICGFDVKRARNDYASLQPRPGNVRPATAKSRGRRQARTRGVTKKAG
jgi:DNA-binding transcriptional ArsR family regulator